MSRTITVTLDSTTTPPTVSVDPNPLPGDQPPVLDPGDTVTWILDETATGRELQPLFAQILELSPGSLLRPCNPLGPFQSLEVVPGGIKGIVRPYVKDPIRKTRFFYKLVEKGVALNWDPPLLPGAPDPTVGGGIDIPTKPPT